MSLDFALEAKRTIAGISTPSLASIFKPKNKKGCLGDFCMYKLAGLADQERGEIDYEEIVRQAQSVYSASNDKEATYFRLEMQLEYLKTEKAKQRDSLVRHSVTCKNIMRGKQILRRAGLCEPDTVMELDVRRLINSIADPVQDAEDNKELAAKGRKCPSVYYQQVKVCERCYAVYTQISHCFNSKHRDLAASQPTSPNSKASKSPSFRTPPRPQKQGKPELSKPSLKHLVNSPVTPKPSKKYFSSPIGKINKDNIDDLLTDIAHALSQSSPHYFRAMTHTSKLQKLQHQLSIDSLTYTPTLHREDLARSSQQCLVIDTLNPIRMKDPQIEGRKSWLKYRRRLNLNIASTN